MSNLGVARLDELRAAEARSRGALVRAGLTAQAQSALDAWSSRGLPTRQLEAWKYTGLTQICDLPFVVPPRPLPAENMRIATIARGAEHASGDLVFYNGHFIPELSRILAVANVSVTMLGAKGHSSFASDLTPARFAQGPWFDAVNASLAPDVVEIFFESQAKLNEPIVITNISSGMPGVRCISAPRVFVRFAAGSQGAVVERCVTLGAEAALSMPSVDVVVEAGAHASYFRSQVEGAVGAHFGSLRATVGRDAHFDSAQISIGARLSRQELQVRLVGEGAEARVDGLYMANKKQHMDNRTSIEHVVGHTTSAQVYKGIVADDARAVFNGRIRIEAQAQKSSAAQLCQNLALSSRAEIDAKPELEIFADDVKASHGATIGRLDPEQLFYLQARAVGAADAAKILARGFALDALARMRNAAAGKIVTADIEAALNARLR